MTEQWGRRRDVLWRHCGDDVVLKRPDDSEFVTVSNGMVLWVALEVPASVVEVAARIAEAVGGVEPSTVVRDIGPVLDDLHRKHLVERYAA